MIPATHFCSDAAGRKPRASGDDPAERIKIGGSAR